MPNPVQSLPPKMLAQYAERARRGDYDHKIGQNIYEWYSGRTRISIIGCDAHAVGHVTRVSPREAEENEKRKTTRLT